MPIKKTDRETILQKSIQVFRKKGYYHTSLSDLSKECEIEKAHFYYYFKDKKDLMKAVINYSHQLVHNAVFIHAYNEALVPLIRLEKMLDNVFRINSAFGLGCFLGNTILETIGTEAEFKEELQNFFNAYLKSLTYIYKTRFPEKEAIEFATEDVQRLQGSVMMSRLYNDFSILDKTISQIKKRLNS